MATGKRQLKTDASSGEKAAALATAAASHQKQLTGKSILRLKQTPEQARHGTGCRGADWQVGELGRNDG